MAPDPPKRPFPKPETSVIRWLLDSDPSIRWQVMRDLTDAPADEVRAERIRVATEGAGARLLARRRRPVAARDPLPRQDAGRDGRGRGPAEPVEHTARLTSVGLVFSTRLTPMSPERDWQRAGLARS
jgi:hypothetical protein